MVTWKHAHGIATGFESEEAVYWETNVGRRRVRLATALMCMTELTEDLHTMFVIA